MNAPREARLPTWAIRIRSVRKALGLDQRRLAQRLGVSQAAVSKWEVAGAEPSTKLYGRIIELCEHDDDKRFFADRMVDADPEMRRTVESVAARMKIVPRQRTEPKGEMVTIPVLADSAAAGSPRLVRDEEIDERISVPHSWTPHPDAIRCVRIEGDSMSPLLEHGFIVAIDTAQNDPLALINEVVAAADSEGGVTVKYLRRVGGERMLISQHTSPRFQPILIDREPGWRIVGKALFWIRPPTELRKGKR